MSAVVIERRNNYIKKHSQHDTNLQPEVHTTLMEFYVVVDGQSMKNHIFSMNVFGIATNSSGESACIIHLIDSNSNISRSTISMNNENF